MENKENPYKPTTYNVDAYALNEMTGDVYRHYRHHTIINTILAK